MQGFFKPIDATPIMPLETPLKWVLKRTLFRSKLNLLPHYKHKSILGIEN